LSKYSAILHFPVLLIRVKLARAQKRVSAYFFKADDRVALTHSGLFISHTSYRSVFGKMRAVRTAIIPPGAISRLPLCRWDTTRRIKLVQRCFDDCARGGCLQYLFGMSDA
jgi:hypothetical protein